MIPVSNVEANTRYANCTELRKSFPNGIARSAAAARAAVANELRKPTVSATTYSPNARLDKARNGYFCTRGNQQQPTAPPAPIPQPPQQVANLTVVPKIPTRQSTAADFDISWQVPSAADISSFLVTLPTGASKTVFPSEGVATTSAIRTYTVQGFAPFSTSTTVTVTAQNSVGQSLPAVVTFATPAAPKRTITVEIVAGTGECASTREVFRFCYISITNASGGQDIYSRMGTWTYEANPGLPVSVFVGADAGNPNTCTTRFDGIVVSTQTTNGYNMASCFAVVSR